MQFLEYQMLEARNLLCTTTRLDIEDLDKSLREADELLRSYGVSDQYATKYIVISDFENPTINLNISMNKKIVNVKKPFWYKERIYLIHAVKTRHEGNLFELWDSLSQLMRYLNTNKLKPITPYYCKILSGLKNSRDTCNMIIDVYVGINGNIS